MKHLASINNFLWKYKVRLLLGIVFIILSNYFKILTPQLTAYVVDITVKKIENKTTVSSNINKETRKDILVGLVETHLKSQNFSEKILWSGIVLFVLAIISGFFMFLMRQTIIVMSRLIEYDQKNQVFDHYQQLDAGFYKVHNTGDLMNRISEDVSRVRMYTGPAIMYIINLVAVIGFSIYYMVKESPKLTLVALAPLPVLAITIYFVNAIIHKRSGYIQALLSDLTTNAQESYSGIRVIKSFVQENAMLGFFTTNSETYRQKVLNLAKTEAIYFPSMALLIGVSTLLTVMVGGLDVIQGHMKIGTIAEFVMYIQMLTFPVSAIGFTAGMIQRAAASQKRINEFLETKPLIATAIDNVKPTLEGSISFADVDFTYAHTGIHAVDHFSLTINKGQKVAIIGRTGSGKSTIAQLLLRMYDPQSGVILYDGIPVNKIDLETLRTQVSYVPQDVFLFSETVHNNIGFGVEHASTEQVMHAATQASIHNDILSFPEQYETIVGERGVTLSGGQKQRISIARALIKDPRIVIFDDCLSAVDARTEQEVLSNLNKYLSDKTAIIITHRIFSLIRFDKIVVLENGRIVEEGTHDTLLQLNGVYTDMYNRQQQQETAS
jgi:ATP-binding cassette, subfamily B, multidrug efflux pump